MRSAGALAVLLLASPQAPPEVVVNAQWSFGRLTPGEWVPVVVDLQNASGRDLDVRVTLEDETLRCRVGRREALPAEGRRRIFLELPGGPYARMFGYSVQPRVTVERADGRRLARFELPSSSVRDDTLLVALVTPVRGSEGSFRFPRQSGNRSVDVARADAGLLPARWTGYTGLDLLVLHDAPLDELSPDQARAILEWVRLGGTVALSPGSRQGWLSHPVLAALAPLEAGPPETRTSLPGLARSQRSLFAAGRPFLHHPIRNGAVDVDTDTRIFSCGMGRVRVLPFDVAGAPFAESAGLEAVWQDVLGGIRPGVVTARPAPALGAHGVLSRISRLINPYPGFGLLAGLTTLFLAVVGPVNWLVLRRLRMTLLLILTVPALSLLFLGITIGAGYFVKGAGTIVAEVRFVAARSGADSGVETGILAVRSPSTRDYRLTFPADRVALPAERAIDERGPYDRPEPGSLQIEDGARLAFADVRIGQWESRGFVTMGTVGLGDGIRFETRGGRMRIVNGSPLPLTRGVLVRPGAGGFSAPFGPVGPGASVEAPLDEARWSPMEDLGFEEGTLGFEALRHLFPGRPRPARPGDRTGEPMLIAILEGRDVRLEIDGGVSNRSRGLTVLLVRAGAP